MPRDQSHILTTVLQHDCFRDQSREATCSFRAESVGTDEAHSTLVSIQENILMSACVALRINNRFKDNGKGADIVLKTKKCIFTSHQEVQFPSAK